jgi:hypothetical protein
MEVEFMRVETVLGAVTVSAYLAGHGVEYVGRKAENGVECSVWRTADDLHGIDIRLEPDAVNKGGRVLWHGTVRTPSGVKPELPEEARLFLNALRAPVRQTRRKYTPTP